MNVRYKESYSKFLYSNPKTAGLAANRILTWHLEKVQYSLFRSIVEPYVWDEGAYEYHNIVIYYLLLEQRSINVSSWQTGAESQNYDGSETAPNYDFCYKSNQISHVFSKKTFRIFLYFSHLLIVTWRGKNNFYRQCSFRITMTRVRLKIWFFWFFILTV